MNAFTDGVIAILVTILVLELGRRLGTTLPTSSTRKAGCSPAYSASASSPCRLEAAGLAVEPTPGHYRVLRDGSPLRKANGMPFMLPFSPDTTRWRRAAIVELRKLDIDV